MDKVAVVAQNLINCLGAFSGYYLQLRCNIDKIRKPPISIFNELHSALDFGAL